MTDLARGPPEAASACCADDGSASDASTHDAGSPTPELQLAGGQRSPGKGSCSDLAPVQILFTVCALTCRRWNKAVRSPQVLRRLSIVRFPLPAASTHSGASGAEAAAWAAGQARQAVVAVGRLQSDRSLPCIYILSTYTFRGSSHHRNRFVSLKKCLGKERRSLNRATFI